MPLGVFKSIERAVYDDLMAEQLESARETSGAGDLEAAPSGDPGSFPVNAIPRGKRTLRTTRATDPKVVRSGVT